LAGRYGHWLVLHPGLPLVLTVGPVAVEDFEDLVFDFDP
jgi:hypothetical protein